MSDLDEAALKEHVKTHDSWYDNDAFFPRLKRDWPEPPEQLHSGGWEITRDMASYVENKLGKLNPTAFDLCCGEGATAIYLAQERGWDVTGLDVNKNAIEKAQKDSNTKLYKVRAGSTPGKASFIRCSAFEMDAVPSSTFDVVYGQDPDALDSPQRIVVFNHIFRILKAGGLFTFHHHWIPGFGWTTEELEAYWEREKTTNLSAEIYVLGLHEAGFEVIIKDDITKLASSHLKGCYARNQTRVKAEGESVRDKWLENAIAELDKGKKFGIRVVAIKPA